ncbi:MAG: T9SS type A sorting domain-containing protein [Bacteroidales bacterium]|jgi:hypothetical protein|nr:T9SS type A sorting domain-containing protein [Bacteroidales bacterium]
MKRITLYLLVFVLNCLCFHLSAQNCDTLRLKVVWQGYELVGEDTNNLNQAHILVDKNTMCYFLFGWQNIREDTIKSTDTFVASTSLTAYVDTVGISRWTYAYTYYVDKDIAPDSFAYYPLSPSPYNLEDEFVKLLRNYADVQSGVRLEMQTSIFKTSMDGKYSDSVFLANMYIDTFYFDFPSAVSLVSEENHLQIYPNPASSELKIKNYQLKDGENVEIIDVLGRVQQSSIINHQSEIIVDVSHLPQGMYFIKIGNWRGKFVVN